MKRATMLFGREIWNRLPRCGVGVGLRRTMVNMTAPPVWSRKSWPGNVYGRLGRRNFAERSIFDLNTNVSKDVLLYRSSSDRMYTFISVLSVVQFGFWLSVADSYNVILNRKRDTDEGDDLHFVPWVDKLKSKGKLITLGVPVGCLCMGECNVTSCAQKPAVRRTLLLNCRRSVGRYMLHLHDEICESVGFVQRR